MEEITGLEGLGPAPSEYHFYNGAVTIFYDDKEHEYTRFDSAGNFIIIPGVTSAVHIIDKSDALTQWAANMATDYIAAKLEAEEQTMRNSLPHLFEDVAAGEFMLQASTVQSWLEDARKNFLSYKKAAAETGKRAHEWIELFIRALMRQDWNEVLELQQNLPEDERARNGVVAALDFMAQHKLVWVHTERKIYSREYDYAGTMDGLAYASSCGNADCCGKLNLETGEREPVYFVNVLAIIDWKTSNRLYDEYHYQTAAYLEAHKEEFPDCGEIPYRFVTRLGKEDAQFEAQLLLPESIAGDFGIFLDCQNLYVKLKLRKKAEKAVRDTVKAILKAAREMREAEEKAAKAALRAEKKARKEAAKMYYKELRAKKIPVVEAERLVAERFAPEPEEEPELEMAA